MKEKHNGWKVLTQGRNSVSGWNNVNKFSVHYPIGKTVYPLKGTKLFFFKLKRDAIYFVEKGLNEWCNPIIVKCVATNLIKSKILICRSNLDLSWVLDDMMEAGEDANWESIIKEYGVCHCPKGTYLADAIKCLE